EGIEGADVMPVLPGFSQKCRVRNAVDRPGAEILERQPCAVLLDFVLQQGTPQHRQHLDIQERRGQQGGVLKEVIELLAEGSAQKVLHGRRSVDHDADHASSLARNSRSCSSSEAAESPRSVAGRCESFSCQSERAISRSMAARAMSLIVR